MFVSQVGEGLSQGVAPRMLSEDQLTVHEPHALRIHDLVRERVGQHPVLMDARLVRECVSAHDRLVRLNLVPGEAAHHAAGTHDLGRLDARPQPAEVFGPRAQDHRHLLETRVSRPLADAIDAHLNLPRANLHAGQGVGDGEAEIVVAVHRHRDSLKRGNPLVQLAEETLELRRHRVPDGVGDVDGASALADGRAHDLGDECRVRASSVLARELDVGTQTARLPHRISGGGKHGCAVHPQLVRHVDVRRGNEGVNARRAGIPHALPGHRDVFLIGAGKRGDRWPPHLARHGLDTQQVARRGNGKAGLDDVNTKSRELMRDFHLLAEVQVDARGLLPVAKGRIEELDALGVVTAGVVGRHGGFLLARVD